MNFGYLISIALTVFRSLGYVLEVAIRLGQSTYPLAMGFQLMVALEVVQPTPAHGIEAVTIAGLGNDVRSPRRASTSTGESADTTKPG